MTQHLAQRPRRLRRTDALRRLVAENTLTASDLIYPVFLLPGANQRQAVASMPGVERLSLDLLFHQAERCLELGVPVLALFPVIEAERKTTGEKPPTRMVWCPPPWPPSRPASPN